MTTLKFHITSVGILLLLASGAGAQEKGGEYSIVAAKSRLEVRVEKEGFLKAFGHNHLIVAKQMSGAVKLDANKVEDSSGPPKRGKRSRSLCHPKASRKKIALTFKRR